MRAVAPLILMVLLPACSFILVQGRPPPSVDPSTNFSCTASQAAPAVDAIVGVLSAGVGGVALANAPHTPCGDYGCIGADAIKGLGVAGLVVGAAFLASSFYGFAKTSSCKEALTSKRAIFMPDGSFEQRWRFEGAKGQESLPILFWKRR